MTRQDDAVSALRIFPDLSVALPSLIGRCDDNIDELCDQADLASESARTEAAKRRLSKDITLENLCGRLVDLAHESIKESLGDRNGLVLPWIYRNNEIGPRAASAISTLSNDLVAVHGAQRVTVVSWFQFYFDGTTGDNWGLGYDPMGDLIWLSVDEPEAGYPILEVRGNGTWRRLRTRFAVGEAWDPVEIGSYGGMALSEIIARGEIILSDEDLNACFPFDRKKKKRSDDVEELRQAAIRAVNGDRAPRYRFLCNGCSAPYLSTVSRPGIGAHACGGDLRFVGELAVSERAPGSWVCP